MNTSEALPRTFGQEHFGEAYLADDRRTRSLIDVADRFHRHPHGTQRRQQDCTQNGRND